MRVYIIGAYFLRRLRIDAAVGANFLFQGLQLLGYGACGGNIECDSLLPTAYDTMAGRL